MAFSKARRLANLMSTASDEVPAARRTLATGSIATAALADDAITSAKIADDAIVAAAIADNSVDIARLNVSDGSNGQALTTNGSGTLSFASVGTADGSISTAKIADDAVTSAKIADDAVVAAAIADNAVDIARLNVSDGSANQVLTTNGSATLSFQTGKLVGKETIYVPAAAMYPNTTAGCADIEQVELSNGPELKCLDFDASSDENAQFTVAFPKSWNEGTVTFQAFFTVKSRCHDDVVHVPHCSVALSGLQCPVLKACI